MLIAQSGGPSPVINMTLLGAVDAALHTENIEHIYGSKNGIEGLLNNQLFSLNPLYDVIKKSSFQPGAILGGSRYSPTESELLSIVNILEELKIGIFCYIGGNGSSRTVKELHLRSEALGKEIKCIHIPKTIDNDLEGTDHTPGYGSAARFIAQTVSWIGADMASMRTYDKVEVIETQGGNSGWLAASSALGKQHKEDYPQLVYLPDRKVTLEEFLESVESVYKSTKSIIAIVPDHLHVTGLRENHITDATGRRYNGGIGYRLHQEINKNLGLKTRYTSPTTMFRTTQSLISLTDQKEAYQFGQHAIHLALNGLSGVMVSLSRISQSPYKYTFTHTDLLTNSIKEKPLPKYYWDENNNMPTTNFIKYATPLIDGEIQKAVDLSHSQRAVKPPPQVSREAKKIGER
jgi:6-phosphofructokinase 1